MLEADTLALNPNRLVQALHKPADDFTKADITSIDGNVDYKATLYDRFGNVLVLGTTNLKLFLDCDVLGQDQVVQTGSLAISNGVVTYSTTNLAKGAYVATLWQDKNNNNQIDADEIVSNSVKVNVVTSTTP